MKTEEFIKERRRKFKIKSSMTMSVKQPLDDPKYESKLKNLAILMELPAMDSDLINDFYEGKKNYTDKQRFEVN